MNKPETTDAYIKGFPKETQDVLQQMRAIVTKAAPKAVEVISYGMPAFKQHGILVYFAGYKSHIGLYPNGSSPIIFFKDELSEYKTSKGAIQFPLDKPLSAALIKKIVQFRISEDEESRRAKLEAKALKQKPAVFGSLGNPAQRALTTAGITTVKQLAKYTWPQILSLHGMGKASLPALKKLLDEAGLSFKK